MKAAAALVHDTGALRRAATFYEMREVPHTLVWSKRVSVGWLALSAL